MPILSNLYQELVRSLLSHEEAIKELLVEYLEDGSKLVHDLESDHQGKRRHIQNEVDTVKKTLGEAYSNSKQQVLEYTKDMKTSPIGDVEIQWREAQEDLQNMIEEGRRESQNHEPGMFIAAS